MSDPPSAAVGPTAADQKTILAACSGPGTFLTLRPPAGGFAWAGPLSSRLGESGVLTLTPPLALGSTWTIEARFRWPLAVRNGPWSNLVHGAGGSRHVVMSFNELGSFLDGEFRDSGFGMSSLADGWHHLAAVRGASTITFYVDGVQCGAIRCDRLSSGSLTDAIQWIGNLGYGNNLSQPFGPIREVAVWGEALSPARVAERASPSAAVPTGATLLAAYRLDGLDDTVKDAAGRGPAGRATWPATEAMGPGRNAAFGVMLPAAASSDFTLECWLPPTSASRRGRLLTFAVTPPQPLFPGQVTDPLFSLGSTYWIPLSVQLSVDGNKRLLHLAVSPPPGQRNSSCTTTPVEIPALSWVHVAISSEARGGATTWTLYVDGVSAGAVDTPGTRTAFHSVALVSHLESLGNLRLWSQVLDGAGVLFRRGLGRVPGSLSGLVGQLVAPGVTDARASAAAVLAGSDWVVAGDWPTPPSLDAPPGGDAVLAGGVARRVAAAVAYVRQQAPLDEAAAARARLDKALKLNGQRLGGGGVVASLTNAQQQPMLFLGGDAQMLTLTLTSNGAAPLWLAPGAEAIRLSFPPGTLDTTTCPTAPGCTITCTPSTSAGPQTLTIQPPTGGAALDQLVIDIFDVKPLGGVRICPVTVSWSVVNASGRSTKGVSTLQLGLSPGAGPAASSAVDDDGYFVGFVSDARIALTAGSATDVVLQFKAPAGGLQAIELDLRTAEWRPGVSGTYALSEELGPATGQPEQVTRRRAIGASTTAVAASGIITYRPGAGPDPAVRSLLLTVSQLWDTRGTPSSLRFRAKIVGGDGRERTFWLPVACRSYVDKGNQIVFDKGVVTPSLMQSNNAPAWKLDEAGAFAADSATFAHDVQLETVNRGQGQKKLVVDETTVTVTGQTVINGVLSAHTVDGNVVFDRNDMGDALFARNDMGGDTNRHLACDQALGATWTAEASFSWPMPDGAVDWHTLFRGDTQHHLLFQKSTRKLGAFYDSSFHESGYSLGTDFRAGKHTIAVIARGGKWVYYVDGSQVGTVTAPTTCEAIKTIGAMRGGGQSFGRIWDVRIWDVDLPPGTQPPSGKAPLLAVLEGRPLPSGVTYTPAAPAAASHRHLACDQALGATWTAEASFLWPMPDGAVDWHTLFRGDTQHHLLFQKSTRKLGAFYDSSFHESGYSLGTDFRAGKHTIAVIARGGKWVYYVDGSQVGTVTAPTTCEAIKTIGAKRNGGQSFGRVWDVRIWDVDLPPGTQPPSGKVPLLAVLEGRPLPSGVTYAPAAPAAPRDLASPGRLLPDGTIVMWNGAVADIPVGWHLCDGRTLQRASGSVMLPNLIDRMVRGGRSPGTSAGSDTVTLTPRELPSHTHTASSKPHSHGSGEGWANANGDGSLESLARGWQSRRGQVANSGDATVSITVDSTGQGQSFSVVPAYWEIAFIAFYPDVK